MANGVLSGVSQAMQLVGLLAIPKIWSLFAEPWPVGQVLAWIIIGITCSFSLPFAQFIRLSVDTDDDD